MGDLSTIETNTTGKQNTPLLILSWGTKSAVCIYTLQKEETGDFADGKMLCLLSFQTEYVSIYMATSGFE